MIEEFWIRVFVVSATLAGAFVTSGALITWDKRPWSDWVMTGGAGLTTIGLAMTTLVAFDLSDWLQGHGEYPCLGSICLGAMMFSMGYRGPGTSRDTTLEELTLALTFVALTIAVVLFATGYLWDRIKRCTADTRR